MRVTRRGILLGAGATGGLIMAWARTPRPFPPPRTPATVIEAAMIGIAFGRENVAMLTDEQLRGRFGELRAHNSLSPEFLAEGLSKPDRVEARLTAAKEIFSRP